MSDFKNFLYEGEVIPNLMKLYGISSKDTEVKDFIYKMVEITSEVDSRKERHQNFGLDMIAKSYEISIPHSQRKIMGEFYTPIRTVDYILKSVGYTDQQNIENKMLMDLSCGSGSFLTRAAKILVERLRLSSDQSIYIIKKIQENIFGIDINPIACVLCQINIYFTLFNLFTNFLENNKEYQLPIFNIFNEDTLQHNFNMKYDYVVGNPPYLFIRAIPQEYRAFIENISLETNKGQYDYYQIFIELGIKILKKNGKLGYIVPDSLLALSNRRIIRKFIYESTKIKEIYYSGPQFDDPVVSNVILTLEKESDELKRKNNQIIIKMSLNKLEAEREIKQNLIEDWDYEFLINLNENDIRILEYLNKNFPKLEDLIESSDFDVKLTRGVELGKEGEVIFCDICHKNYPLPSKDLKCPECKSNLNSKFIDKIIVNEIPNGLESNFKPFIYSMNRYVINELKYIDMTKRGINYKNLDIYKDRIVIRQISQENLICATYHNNATTSQSYYNLKVKSSPILEFNNLYLLGLLNSQLLSYYFIKSFGSYKKLFPRVLIEKLKALPLKVPEKSSEKQMARTLAENIQNILKNMKENKETINRLQMDSDLLVFHLFDIDKKDQEYIINFIKNLKRK